MLEKHPAHDRRRPAETVEAEMPIGASERGSRVSDGAGQARASQRNSEGSHDPLTRFFHHRVIDLELLSVENFFDGISLAVSIRHEFR
jgi:hypothetical protein